MVGTGVVRAQAASCDFAFDSLPVPGCRRVRAGRCGHVRRRDYCGYCVAKNAKVFGRRLHLVCSTDGVPVACVVLPASDHDLMPSHELLYGLPPSAYIYADKADNRAPTKRASWPRPACIWSRCAKTPWCPTPGPSGAACAPSA
jgi:hypothetical protein